MVLDVHHGDREPCSGEGRTEQSASAKEKITRGDHLAFLIHLSVGLMREH